MIFGTLSHGIWGVRLGKFYCCLKAPWNAPLFSERYGYYSFKLPLPYGWRIISRWLQ